MANATSGLEVGGWIRPRLVFASPDRSEARRCSRFFEGAGFEVVCLEDGDAAINLLEVSEVDALVAEIRAPRIDGAQLMQVARRLSGSVCVVVLAQQDQIDLATKAVQAGAYDYQTRPLNLEKLLAIVRRGQQDRELRAQLNDLQRRLDRKYGVHNILGNSAAISEVMSRILQVAPSDASVLIRGETGTGKELVAIAIHQNSARRNGPLIKLHCGDLSEGLVESELFGHEKGAFTGAQQSRKGRFELADGGSLFLDGVGELPLASQAKLLRVLSTGEYERVGGEVVRRTDVRVLASTSSDLLELVRSGRFREDLYYRLAVVRLDLPALRHRRQDIPLLIDHFRHEAAATLRREAPGISPRAMNRLLRYEWPGNVRELKNVITGMVLSAERDAGLDVEDLPPPIRDIADEGEGLFLPLGTPLMEAERRLIEATLKYARFDKQAAAKMLGVSVRTLFRRAAQYIKQ
ncbi:MAG: sigma-54 dependent transcriptional regulator [Candidatus Eisenbacteria bacterium]